MSDVRVPILHEGDFGKIDEEPRLGEAVLTCGHAEGFRLLRLPPGTEATSDDGESIAVKWLLVCPKCVPDRHAGFVSLTSCVLGTWSEEDEGK